MPWFGKGTTVMITIPLNTNSGIRISAKPADPKPERKPAESIPQIGVSIPQATKMLNIGKPLMSLLVRTGQIRAIKLGKRIVVSVQSLREFVDGKNTPRNSTENAELPGEKSKNAWAYPRLLFPEVQVTS